MEALARLLEVRVVRDWIPDALGRVTSRLDGEGVTKGKQQFLAWAASLQATPQGQLFSTLSALLRHHHSALIAHTVRFCFCLFKKNKTRLNLLSGKCLYLKKQNLRICDHQKTNKNTTSVS